MRRRISTAVAAALLVAGTGFLFAPRARADEPVAPPPAAPPLPPPVPVPAPAPAPLPPSGPGTPSSAEPNSESENVTAEELNRLVWGSPGAIAAMVLLKFATALAGFIFLILAWVRWRDVRRGLAPPLPTLPPPPAPFSIGPALGLAILAIVGGGLLVLGVSKLRGAWNAETDPIGVGIAATGLVMVPTAIVIGVAIHRRRRELGSPAPSPGAALKMGFLAFCVASLVVLGVSVVTTWALEALFGRKPEAQELIGRLLHPTHAKDPWLIAAFGVLVAPVTEECVFRGMLFPGLRTKLGPWVAAVLSAILFGLVHNSLSAFLPLFALALLLAGLYQRTGSLLACMVVHALNNATSLLPLFLLK